MNTLSPIGSVARWGSGWRWQMAGTVFLAAILLASPARARQQIDFSLDREIRWRVAPAFTVNASPFPAASSAPPSRPTVTPPRIPSRRESGTTEAGRQGLTLVRLPFAL